MNLQINMKKFCVYKNIHKPTAQCPRGRQDSGTGMGQDCRNGVKRLIELGRAWEVDTKKTAEVVWRTEISTAIWVLQYDPELCGRGA